MKDRLLTTRVRIAIAAEGVGEERSRDIVDGLAARPGRC